MNKSLILAAAVVAALAAGALSDSIAHAADATPAPLVPPATQPAVDLKNTKCIIMPDDDVDSAVSVTYEGKVYHFCCEDCVKKFNKNPEKYAKMVEKDPSKYGIKG